MDWDKWKENYVEWTRSVHPQVCKSVTSLSVCFLSHLLNYVSISQNLVFLFLNIFLRGRNRNAKQNHLQNSLFTLSFFFLSLSGTLQAHTYSVKRQKKHSLVSEIRSADVYFWMKSCMVLASDIKDMPDSGSFFPLLVWVWRLNYEWNWYFKLNSTLTSVYNQI